MVIRNRKARHEFEILEELEAGLVLVGSEVKSLRAGHATFTDAFARIDGGELWLYNLHINPYGQASIDVPDPMRRRKLLASRRQIDRLAIKTTERGLTLVPLDLHFTRGRAKVTLGLGKGKKQHDKRASDKDRDWQRQKARMLKAK